MGLLKKEGSPVTFGKLKPKHSANKVSSQVEATWKYTLPTCFDKSLLKELWRTQMNHLSKLLNEIEEHPGFHRDWQPPAVIPVSEDLTFVSTTEVHCSFAFFPPFDLFVSPTSATLPDKQAGR